MTTTFIHPLPFLRTTTPTICSTTTTTPRRPPKTTIKQTSTPANLRRPRNNTTSLTDLIQEHDLLTLSEEQTLLKSMQILRDEATLIKELSRKPTDKELAQFLQIPQSDLPSRRKQAFQARNDLIASHMRMVLRVASRIRRAAGAHPPALHDLVQEGCYALLRAAEKFDPGRQVRFFHYARTAVSRACSRAVRPAGCIIEIPERLRVAVGKKRKESVINGEFYTKLSDEKVDHNDDTQQDYLVKLAERHMRSALSLTEVVVSNSDGELTLMDTLPSQRGLPEQVVQGEMIRDLVRRACRRRLKDKHADMLEMRFGLGGKPPMTSAAIARFYGLSQSRVGQIILAALEKLRETEPELEELMYEL